MRTAEEIMNLILGIAAGDNRIRAVLLTGSRANPDSKKDRFQDFDIIYFVNEMNSFVSDKSWIDIFGERLILQVPHEMTIGEKGEPAYHYLMLFKDHNRIDLALYPLEKLHTGTKLESLATVLLDKDNLFCELPLPSDADYWIKAPTEKEFCDCCNEFWWVSTYVAKGLWRHEITYAKEFMEGAVREMFMKMVAWVIGTETAFSVSFGKGGRHLQQQLSPQLYSGILATYAGSSVDENWHALLRMAGLFNELAIKVANRMNFVYKQEEADNALNHLWWVKSQLQDRQSSA